MFKDLSEVNGNVLSYVAGFLYKKSMLKHSSCEHCNLSKENSHFTELIDLKLYNSDCKLMRPPISFIKYIEDIGIVFGEHYPELESQHQVGLKLYKLIDKVYWHNMCKDFPKVFLIKLFIRM